MRKISLLVIGMILVAASVTASPIDFRGADFAPALNQPSFNITVDGLGLEFIAEPAGPQTKLWWDNLDGIGIQSLVGYEPDEIEGPELLKLFFSKPVVLNSIHLTDLFNEHGYLEIGRYQLSSGTKKIVEASVTEILGGTNGELLIPTQETINFIFFSAPGLFGGENHEYSVGGVDVSPVAPVPIPSSILLFASGIIGIVGIRRKLKS